MNQREKQGRQKKLGMSRNPATSLAKDQAAIRQRTRLLCAALLCAAVFGVAQSSCQNGIYSLASQKKVYDIKVSAGRGGLVRASGQAASSLSLTANNKDVIGLTAVPNAHFIFAGWTVTGSASVSSSTDLGTSLTVNGTDTTVTASFTPEPTHTITVTSTTGGAVYQDIPANAAASLKIIAYTGDRVSLTALPEARYRFSGWSLTGDGTLSGTTAAAASLTVGEADANISANFALYVGEAGVGTADSPANLQLSLSGTWSLSNTDKTSHGYSYSATVGTAVVTPSSVAWRLDGTVVGSAASYSATGSTLSLGIHTLSCEVVYHGYAYSISHIVTVTGATAGTLKWKYPSTPSVTVTTDPIAPSLGTDGTIYYSGQDSGTGAFYAALSVEGTLKWSYNSAYTIYLPLAVGKNGHIYAGTVNSVDMVTDGGSSAILNELSGYNAIGGPAIGPQGWFYISSSSAYLDAFTDVPAGDWQCALATTATSPPVVSMDGSIYVGVVQVLSKIAPRATSHTPLWSYDLGAGSQIRAAPAIWSADSSIYFTDNGATKRIFAITDSVSSYTLKASWTTNPLNLPDASELASGPVIAPDGTIYIVYTYTSAGGGVRLQALSNVDGSLQGNYDVSGASWHGGAAIASDGTVYFCAGSAAGSYLYAARRSGSVVTPAWRYPSGAGIVSSVNNSYPVIGPDGTVYFGDSNGTIYAVYGSSGPATTGWAMLGKNARRSGYAGDAQ
jgi:outer membrane protein assembly factor BamB